MQVKSTKGGPRPPFVGPQTATAATDLMPKDFAIQLQSPLKWAGGKRWLASELRQILPTKFDHYFEPFAGGASVFFSLAPKKAVLADLNRDLIATYEGIQANVDAVWNRLRKHAKNHSTDYYYQVRHEQPRSPIEIAARFLYLNRTCWNGLFRVNLRGHFNVPKGTKSRVLLLADAPEEYSKALQNAELYWSDFEMLVDAAGNGDLIYADPPYTVKHNLNGFLKYNEAIFSWADQERLASSLLAAKKRGAFVVISNADHPSVRALYEKSFSIRTVSRSSVIAGDARFRTPTTELLIVGEPTRRHFLVMGKMQAEK